METPHEPLVDPLRGGIAPFLQFGEPPEPMRTWTDATGQFKTEATLDGFTPEGKARLKQKNGRSLEIPLDKFSPEDKKYLLERIPKS
jgi:hypothetical protein